MAVADTNIRIKITVPRDRYGELQAVASRERRSVSGLLAYVALKILDGMAVPKEGGHSHAKVSNTASAHRVRHSARA